MPDFKMIGDSPHRKCQANGEWTGMSPRCLELAIVTEMENNNLEGRSDEQTGGPDFEASKAIGIGIAIGSGALLILIIITAVVCLKT
jgi:hypothetical protein